MKFDHRSVASISFHEAGGDEFLGTGFLVTKKHVVTCAHVLPGNTGNWNRDDGDGNGEFNQIGRLTLHFGGKRTSGEQRTAAKIVRSPDDLAVITLDKPVNLPPVRLVSALGDYKGVLPKIQGQVIGFSRSKSSRSECKLVWRDVQNQLTTTWDFYTHDLLITQLSGGLPQGMSGSPFIVEYEKGGVCFAVASLGGEDRAIAVLIGAAVVIQFLKTNLVPLKTVRAADCFNNSHILLKAMAIAVMAILVGAFVAAFPFSYRLVGSDPSSHHVSAGATGDEPNAAPCTTQTQGLTDEQVRFYILKALHSDQPNKAVCFLLGMGASAEKVEECKHITDYALKNTMPDLAQKVLEQCGPGVIPQNQILEINRQRAKQQYERRSQ
jgi:Trypsin-like peptidase domain